MNKNNLNITFFCGGSGCSGFIKFLNNFENYSGLFFMDNNNPKTIAKSVSNCIKNYKNYIPRENEGKELIRDNFTWKIQANKINLFLNKL